MVMVFREMEDACRLKFAARDMSLECCRHKIKKKKEAAAPHNTLFILIIFLFFYFYFYFFILFLTFNLLKAILIS